MCGSSSALIFLDMPRLYRYLQLLRVEPGSPPCFEEALAEALAIGAECLVRVWEAGHSRMSGMFGGYVWGRDISCWCLCIGKTLHLHLGSLFRFETADGHVTIHP